MELTQDRAIVRYQNGIAAETTDQVVREYSLLLLINDQEHSRLLCSPAALEELVVGYAFGEGLLRSMDDVRGLSVDAPAGVARLRLARDWSASRAVPVLTTGLGPQKSLAYAQGSLLDHGPLADGFSIAAARVSAYVEQLQNNSSLFAATGGVHSCALFDSGGPIVFFDDVGRHNALDKLIGHALRRRLSLAQTLVVTSGRIPGYMVLKCYRAGIPLVVTRAAVTDAAIELAQAAHMGLAGFARGQRMNIYSGRERFTC